MFINPVLSLIPPFILFARDRFAKTGFEEAWRGNSLRIGNTGWRRSRGPNLFCCPCPTPASDLWPLVPCLSAWPLSRAVALWLVLLRLYFGFDLVIVKLVAVVVVIVTMVMYFHLHYYHHTFYINYCNGNTGNNNNNNGNKYKDTNTDNNIKNNNNSNNNNNY